LKKRKMIGKLNDKKIFLNKKVVPNKSFNAKSDEWEKYLTLEPRVSLVLCLNLLLSFLFFSSSLFTWEMKGIVWLAPSDVIFTTVTMNDGLLLRRRSLCLRDLLLHLLGPAPFLILLCRLLRNSEIKRRKEIPGTAHFETFFFRALHFKW